MAEKRVEAAEDPHSLEALLAELAAAQIQLQLQATEQGEQLRLLAPKGQLNSLLTPPLQAALKSHKSALLRQLRWQRGPVAQPVTAKPTTQPTTFETAPMSPVQQRLWFLQQLQPHSTAYHETAAFQLSTRLSLETFTGVLQQLCERQAILRTGFVQQAGKVWQQVTPQISLPLQTGPWQPEQARLWREQPFELGQAPLWRVALWETGDPASPQILEVVMHHLITDFWSTGLFVQEISQLWQGQPLPPLAVSYADICRWLQDKPRPTADQQAACLAGYQGLPLVQELPLSGQGGKPEGALAEWQLPAEQLKALQQRCAELGVTRFSWLFWAWQSFLRLWFELESCLQMIPGSGRFHRLMEPVLGCFVDTWLYPCKSELNQPFAAQVQAFQNHFPSWMENALPFEQLIEALNPARDTPYFPQFGFVMQSGSLEPPQLGAAQLSWLPLAPGQPKFELLLGVLGVLGVQTAQTVQGPERPERQEALRLQLHYAAERHHPQVAQALLQYFAAFLAGLLADSQASAASCFDNLRPSLQAPAAPVFKGWLHQFVEQQAAQQPEQMALHWLPEAGPEQQLSYASLNAQANRWAHWLQAQGVVPGDKIGIWLPPTPAAICAQLAVLKAGAAYLPFDQAVPLQRLLEVLAESGAKGLITAAEQLKECQVWQLQTLIQHSADCSPLNLNLPVRAEDLAYLISTSGSTGVPNAVCISHANAARLFTSFGKRFSFDAKGRWLLFHSLAFDFSVWEIWGAFFAGATLVIAPQGQLRDPQALWQLIDSARISLLNQSPSALHSLARLALQRGHCGPLKTLILSSEKFELPRFQAFLERFAEQLQIFVSYGITETTVFVSWRQLRAADHLESRAVIGPALQDLGMHLLDTQLRPVLRGQQGELYVSGAGLSRGYFQRPQLNQQRFLIRGDVRLYKSGDAGRHDLDGEWVYLQRLDQQLKLRGHRIESAEITRRLEALPGIEAAHVKLWQPSGDSNPAHALLLAYVLSQQPQPEAPLKQALRQHLPEYMVPARIVSLQSFPLNQNGKLNSKALPPPSELAAQLPGSDTTTNPASPLTNTPTQQRWLAQLQQLFGELLGNPDLDPELPFFELGAHSLLLVEAKSRLDHLLAQELPGLELQLHDFFQYPSLQQLSVYLAQQSQPATVAPSSPQNDLQNDLQNNPQHSHPQQPQGTASGLQKIAIIGIGLRFPDADSPWQFWQNLSAGHESVRALTEAELKEAGVSPHEYQQPGYVAATAWREGIEDFAARHFGYSPQEARLLDPQQRLMLELALETLEQAGYGDTRQPQPVGVFASSGLSQYLLFHVLPVAQQLGLDPMQALVANDKDYLATRVAYKLNLTGPALSIQSACSSSLAAVYQACQALRRGECRMALAGGVTLQTRKMGYSHLEGGIYSRDGHCRPFDADASGIVGGSGGAWVLLKPLELAQADGDPIWAVIRGGAINNDGAQKAGFLAPGLQGQVAMLQTALKDAQVASTDLGLIEAHGTGTLLGDPIELAALRQVFTAPPEITTDTAGDPSAREQAAFISVGSVKGNLGHLDAAAGVAGLIKVALMLQQRQKLPTINLRQANPSLQLEQSCFRLQTQLEPWQKRQVAGVSALGVGGTNVHLVLEAAPAAEPSLSEAASAPHQQASSGPVLLPVSAPAAPGAEAGLQALQYWPPEQLAALSQAQQARQHHPWRAVWLVDPHTGQQKSLPPVQALQDPRLVFVCPGLGSQCPQLGAGIYQASAVYRQAVDSCQELLKPIWPHDLKALLLEPQPEALLARPCVMQPLIFVSSYALAQVWLAAGLQPRALLGHSFGEYTAACLAGMASLAEMLTLVVKRAELFEALAEPADPQAGAVLAWRWPAAAPWPALPPDISLAAVNRLSPQEQRLTLSGPRQALEAFAAAHPDDCRWLKIPHVVHHALLEGLLPELKQAAQAVSWQAPQWPVVSGLSGQSLTAAQIGDMPSYWCQQARATIHFAQGLKSLSDPPAGNTETVFLELGQRSLQACFPAGALLPSLDADPSRWQLLPTLGQLWQRGFEFDWQAFFEPRPTPRRSPLLPTPLPRERYWLPPVALAGQTNLPTLALNPDAVGQASASGLRPDAQPLETSFWGLSWQQHWPGPQLKAPEVLVRELDSPQAPAELLEGLQSSPGQQLVLRCPIPKGLAQAQALCLKLLQILQALQQVKTQQGSSWQGTLSLLTPPLNPVIGTETLQPEAAPLLALFKGLSGALTAESQIQVRWLESDTWPELPLAELAETPETAPWVALRQGRRWLPSWLPLAFANPAATAHSGPFAPGIYLFTGGNGGLAQALARTCLQTPDSQIYLCCRQLDFLENNATSPWLEHQRVHYRQLDISAESAGEQLSQVLQELAVAHPGLPFKALLHTAGSNPEMPLQQISAEALQAGLAAKLQGSLQLAQALQNLPAEQQPETVVLFSSLSPYLQAPGQALYNAANGFLDAFAQAQNHHRPAQRPYWLSINWGHWAQVGMAQRLLAQLPSAYQFAYQQFLALGIQPEAGAQALASALQQAPTRGLSQLAISPLPLSQLQSLLQHWQQPALPPSGLNSLGLSEQASPQERIQAVWQQLLGLEQIDPASRFSELGGDSLMALQMKAQLQALLQQEVPLSLLIQDLPLQQLAEALSSGIANDPQQLADMPADQVPAAGSAVQASTAQTQYQQTVHTHQQATPHTVAAPEVLIRLNTATQGQPLLLVHAISGTVFPFVPLADGQAFPVYGLQSTGLTGHAPQADLKAMARTYCQAIEAQFAPPYWIGGWSFGALVAFEMAAYWLQRQLAVSQLLLLDMQAPAPASPLQVDNAELRSRFQADLAGLGLGERDQAFQAQLQAIFNAHVQASAAFQPRRLALPAQLLVAQAGFGQQDPRPDLGWGHWLPQLQISQIAGDHYSFLKLPALKHWLTGIQPDSPRQQRP